MTWQYIAGFFDGEGNVQVRLKPSGALIVRARMSQRTHRSQVVHEIAKFLKHHGIQLSISERYQLGGFQTEIDVCDKDSVAKFFDAIWPYIIVKRDEVRKARAALRRYNTLKRKHGNRYVQFMFV